MAMSSTTAGATESNGYLEKSGRRKGKHEIKGGLGDVIPSTSISSFPAHEPSKSYFLGLHEKRFDH